MASGDWKAQIGRMLGSAVRAGAVSALRNLTKGNLTKGRSTGSTTRSRSTSAPAPTRSRSASHPAPSTRAGSQAGTRSRPSGQTSMDDFPGVPVMEYSPHDDGLPDPGEIVWTWVPFEEDHSQGKDRPVLIVGRDGGSLLGLMLTSKDHDRDAAQEARYGRHWTDIGTGSWDAQRRPSEIRVDRVLRIDPSAVRREGAVLDRKRFEAVAAEVARVKR